MVDHVYDEWASTDEVYASTIKPLVTGVLCGEPGAVIAYGATGSGKTHTMLGGPERPERPGAGARSKSRGRSASPRRTSSNPPAGLIPMAVSELFFQIETAGEHHDRDVRVHVSYLEVYQERVYDLLDPGRADVAIRHTPSQGFYPESREVLCRSVGDVEQLLQQAEVRRRVGGTAANERSNRSHCVLQVHVHSFDISSARLDEDRDAAAEGEDGYDSNDDHSSGGDDVAATLAFVDLAGSERVARTAASGVRLQEARGINKSLLALSQLVKALERVGLDEDVGKFSPDSHLPYRDAKLTQLLQPSLSGAGRTVMICCVCLADLYLEETARTLHFARSVRHIKLQPTPRADERAQEQPSSPRILEEYAQLQRDHARLASEHEELELEFRRERAASAAAESKADETDVRLARLLKALQRYVKGDRGESSPSVVAPQGWEAFTDSLMMSVESSSPSPRSTSSNDGIVMESQAEEMVYDALCEMMDGTEGALAQRAAFAAKEKAKIELAELGLSRKLRPASPPPRWIEARRPKEIGDLSSAQLETLLDEAAAEEQKGTRALSRTLTPAQLEKLREAHDEAMRSVSLTLLRRMELEAKGDSAGANAAVRTLTEDMEAQLAKVRNLVREFDQANVEEEQKRAHTAEANRSFEQDRERLAELAGKRASGEVISATEHHRLKATTRRVMVVLEQEVAMLRNVPFLADLSEEQMVRLACRMKRCEAQRDENIVEEGEAGDAMFVLVEGTLEVFISGTNRSHTSLSAD